MFSHYPSRGAITNNEDTGAKLITHDLPSPTTYSYALVTKQISSAPVSAHTHPMWHRSMDTQYSEWTLMQFQVYSSSSTSKYPPSKANSSIWGTVYRKQISLHCFLLFTPSPAVVRRKPFKLWILVCPTWRSSARF